jgi:acyl-coenzyme A synthetase/AMP-(fatty) acid ligase
MDDVINVTGHRLGTAEVEDVMVKNILPKVLNLFANK